MPKSNRRKKRKVAQAKKKKVKKAVSWFWLLSFFLLILILGLFFWKFTHVQKFSYVRKTGNGGAEIVTFDPNKERLQIVSIPENTQLELSQSLGTYKLKSAWELAKDEGKDGSLIASTIVKNFSLPVFYWKNEVGSNLGFLKKIKTFLIEKNLLHLSKDFYDLIDTSVLKESDLKDGSRGFLVVGDIPSYIFVNFSDEREVSLKAEIIDSSRGSFVSEKISSILSVMNIKVSKISREDLKDSECYVSGKDKNVVIKLSKILNCGVLQTHDSESDLTIKIGEEYAKRY